MNSCATDALSKNSLSWPELSSSCSRHHYIKSIKKSISWKTQLSSGGVTGLKLCESFSQLSPKGRGLGWVSTDSIGKNRNANSPIARVNPVNPHASSSACLRSASSLVSMSSCTFCATQRPAMGIRVQQDFCYHCFCCKPCPTCKLSKLHNQPQGT